MSKQMNPCIVVVVEGGVVVDILKSIEYEHVPVFVVDLDSDDSLDSDRYVVVNTLGGLFTHQKVDDE